MKRLLLLVASILLLTTSFYFACQKEYKWNEVKYMTIKNEGANVGDTLSGPINVEVTRDYSQLSNIFLFLSLSGFLLAIFPAKKTESK
jgi:hypothetical protein